MPVSPHNQKIIDTLQPEFGRAVYLWANDCLAAKIPLYLVEGARSFARSDDLYAQGRTKPGRKVTNARAGQSYHNYALAIDAVLLVDGKPSWDFDPAGAVWQKVVALAKARGLAWGGDWVRFKDAPHFQPARVPTLAACRRRWPRGWKG